MTMKDIQLNRNKKYIFLNLLEKNKISKERSGKKKCNFLCHVSSKTVFMGIK